MTKIDDFIGRTFNNKKGQTFTIIDKIITKPGKANRYLLEFKATGYKSTAEKVHILRGTIKDRFEKSVFNVGYLGNTKMVSNKAAYTVWNGMLERCYDTKCERYPDYGAAGVRVSERWHCFEFFLEDIELIVGYEKEAFEQRKIFLDKDIKQKGVPKSQKVYSLSTCCFVSREVNNRNRDLTNAKLHFIATPPNGDSFYVEGLRPFAEKYKLHRKAIKNCLMGHRSDYDGWKFELIKESNWRQKKSSI